MLLEAVTENYNKDEFFVAFDGLGEYGDARDKLVTGTEKHLLIKGEH